jgi:CRISPR-associated endonuclease/helicase Cas3
MYSVVTERIANAGLSGQVRACRLLGGSTDNDIILAPDEPAVLVGTQDLLLSRALNRGYARRPFRWPVDFALLNNDCYWVLDEVQLLGDGLATSAQLAAFRQHFNCFGPTPSCWISATFDPTWLSTVDLAALADEVRVLTLDAKDRDQEVVQRRLAAEKQLASAPEECRLPSGVADFCVAQHRPGTLSLVVVNTVARAREIYIALEKRKGAELLLLHSRFRAVDRAERTARLTKSIPREGRIVVATQVMEAGIDISADLLITDVAPYPSLVQRFGRVNRYGEQSGCRIFWVDRPLTAKRKGWADAAVLKPKEQEEVAMPYPAAELSNALHIVRPLHSAAPNDLPPVTAPAPWEHVLRRGDLLDLFDTTPDLAGNEIDISRFVRSSNERDVYLAWRDWSGGGAPLDQPEIEEAELCPAPINEVRAFAKKRSSWCWSPLEDRWKQTESIYPGATLLLHSSCGGYNSDHGWSPENVARVVPVTITRGPEPEELSDDCLSHQSYRQELADHSEAVVDAANRLLQSLGNLEVAAYAHKVEAAARHHDWGKGHPIMQETLHNGPGPYKEILAKQTRGLAARHHSVPFFRHELASALAILGDSGDPLVAYLAAAHHGRVRVSIRSMPGERDTGADIARGVRDGDVLLPVNLGGAVEYPAVILTLAPMAIGRDGRGHSWTDGVLRLRDSLGPFRLAYLETLLRAADELASKEAAPEVLR